MECNPQIRSKSFENVATIYKCDSYWFTIHYLFNLSLTKVMQVPFHWVQNAFFWQYKTVSFMTCNRRPYFLFVYNHPPTSPLTICTWESERSQTEAAPSTGRGNLDFIHHFLDICSVAGISGIWVEKDEFLGLLK